MKTPRMLAALSLCLTLISTACGQDDERASCTDAKVPVSAKGVAADLTAFWAQPCAKGAYLRVAGQADLFEGHAAQGRVGDYAIGNGRVRFIIQSADRHSGPCPWGGNLIDADLVRPAGEPGQDEMGEYCLLFNLGRTMRAESFEILNDGAQGGPAVLAVSGQDTLLDFINVSTVVEQYLGIKLKLPFDPDADVPLQVTRYFVLPPQGEVLHVLTALRNTGKTPLSLSVGELIDSGGKVEFFNPASKLGGFGYANGSMDSLDFLAFRGRKSSHMYAPATPGTAPGAAYLAISGVAGVVTGTSNAMEFLSTPAAKLADHPATVNLAPEEVVVRRHMVVVGDGGLSSLTGPLWQARGVQTGRISGVVRDDLGQPAGDLRVSVLDPGGHAVTQVLTDAQGAFGLDLPPGSWRLASADRGHATPAPAQVEVLAGKKTDGLEVQVSRPGTLDVTIRTPGGKPTPAKITVTCEGECKGGATSPFADVTFDKLPKGVAAVAFAGMDGAVRIDLPPGSYRVVATKGHTWSIWPDNAHLAGGKPFDVKAGEATDVQAVLAQAVDTAGWMSADLHVHAIDSPDSPVTHLERVRTFLAEGVDILVSTDHDYVADLRPAIAELGAQEALVGLSGVEATTFDYGHFNVFPIDRKATDLTGGALDWGGGEGQCLHPTQIKEGLAAMGSGPVLQVNHPAGGYLTAIEVDIASGTSAADPRKFRIAPPDQLPPKGDTGLFDPGFTAVELLNGYSLSKFRKVAHWWFALLSRGVRWTGTAASDTHKQHSNQSGGPRTWVQMGAGKDSAATFDAAVFTQGIHSMAALASNGPFVRVTAIGPKGNKAGMGQTLAVSPGDEVRFEIEVQAPAWMSLDAVELYDTPTNTAPPAGKESSEVIKPDQWVQLLLGKEHLVPGVDKKTSRWLRTVQMKATAKADSYFVFMVKGAKALPAALVGGSAVTPFACTNPIFVDVDGGGYDHPPLKWSAAPPPPPPPPAPSRGPTFDDLEEVLARLGRLP